MKSRRNRDVEADLYVLTNRDGRYYTVYGWERSETEHLHMAVVFPTSGFKRPKGWRKVPVERIVAGCEAVKLKPMKDKPTKLKSVKKMTNERMRKLIESAEKGKKVGTVDEWRHLALFYRTSLKNAGAHLDRIRELQRNVARHELNLNEARSGIAAWLRCLDSVNGE